MSVVIQFIKREIIINREGNYKLTTQTRKLKNKGERKKMSGTKKIYTEHFNCASCQKPIEEYAKGNKSRTIKSWLSICNSCWNKINRRVEKLEKKVFKSK